MTLPSGRAAPSLARLYLTRLIRAARAIGGGLAAVCPARAWLPARRPEGIERDRAHFVPSDLLAAEYRPVHAGARHPGDAVAAHDRQHAGHAHADAAGHRLFHRRLHRNVVA